MEILIYTRCHQIVPFIFLNVDTKSKIAAKGNDRCFSDYLTNYNLKNGNISYKINKTH